MSALDRRRVVVADADDQARRRLAEFLRRHGSEVFEAVNGLEALLHVKRQHPGAVVLDLRMPRLGGLEALKRIRAFDPKIVVVIVSDALDAEIRREAERIGAAAVLDKPVDPNAVLPALGASSAATAAPPEPIAVPAPASRTVLVVDDDAEICSLLEEFLVSKGYRVRTVADGAAAIRDLVAAASDVILLDIDMPGLSGMDALPTLRAVAPRAAIIMVSGTTNEEVAKRTLAAGAFDYVTKPIDFVRLVDTIETALAMHAAL